MGWPNFTIQHKDALENLNDSESLVFELIAQDVFGNAAYTEFELDDATGWNLSTTTEPMTTDMDTTDIMPVTSDMESTMESTDMTEPEEPTTTKGDGKKSEKLQHGLDDVPGYVWLILLCAALWWRSKSQMDEMVDRAGNVGKSPYVQMDDK